MQGPGVIDESALSYVATALVSWQGGGEYCGLLCRDKAGSYILVELPNRSWSPTEFFVAAPDWFRITRMIARRSWHAVAIVHTHPWSDAPSEGDRLSIATSSLPWIIFGQRSGRCTVFCRPRRQPLGDRVEVEG